MENKEYTVMLLVVAVVLIARWVALKTQKVFGMV